MELSILKITTYSFDYFFRFRESTFFKLRKYHFVVDKDIKTMKFSRFQLNVDI